MKNQESVEILLEDLDENNISSILKKWSEIVNIKKELETLEEMLRTKTKVYLKERKWNRYVDKETKISVTLNVHKRETIDKKQLEFMLTPAQLAQVKLITTVERLSIMTQETRKKIRNFIK